MPNMTKLVLKTISINWKPAVRWWLIESLFSAIPKPNSLSDVKTRVMDMTQSRLAQLANYLGYGWCGGCAAQFVGEDFRRNRDSLEAVTKGPCKGYMSNQRLKMHYKQFCLSVKEIKYGKEVIQDLPPKIYGMGVVTNPTDGNITRTVTRFCIQLFQKRLS